MASSWGLGGGTGLGGRVRTSAILLRAGEALGEDRTPSSSYQPPMSMQMLIERASRSYIDHIKDGKAIKNGDAAGKRAATSHLSPGIKSEDHRRASRSPKLV